MALPIREYSTTIFKGNTPDVVSQQRARNGGGVIEGGRLVGRASRPTGAALRGLRFVAGCRWEALCAMGGVGVLAAT